MPFREAIGMLAGNWRFWLLPIYNSGGLIFLWGFNAWLPTYLQKARHFDLAHTGFYSSLPFMLMIVGEIGAAWIGDRTGKRALVCFVSLFMTGVFLWFAALAPGAELAAWCLAFSAGFWGGTTPTLFSLGHADHSAPDHRHGVGHLCRHCEFRRFARALHHGPADRT